MMFIMYCVEVCRCKSSVRNIVLEKSVYVFTIKKNSNRKWRTIFQLWRLDRDRMFCGIFKGYLGRTQNVRLQTVYYPGRDFGM